MVEVRVGSLCGQASTAFQYAQQCKVLSFTAFLFCYHEANMTSTSGGLQKKEHYILIFFSFNSVSREHDGIMLLYCYFIWCQICMKT